MQTNTSHVTHFHAPSYAWKWVTCDVYMYIIMYMCVHVLYTGGHIRTHFVMLYSVVPSAVRVITAGIM